MFYFEILLSIRTELHYGFRNLKVHGTAGVFTHLRGEAGSTTCFANPSVSGGHNGITGPRG